MFFLVLYYLLIIFFVFFPVELRNGQDVQKVYALNNLPETLKDLSSDDSNIVFDLLNEMLCSDNVSKELCIISGNVLSQIVKDGHVNREIIITHFFDNHIMKNLTSKDKGNNL